MTQANIKITAEDKTAAAFASVSRQFDQLAGGASALVGRLSGIGVVLGTAMTALKIQQSITVLDQLDDMAEKTGIAVEQLSALRFASEAAGTSQEQLGSGLRKLSKLMAEAAGGNKEAAAVFQAIGVDATDASGKLRGAGDVLLDIAQRFAGYEDGAGKAALAQKVFGKSGEDMIPLLNKGRAGIEALKQEAAALGAVYDGDVAKAAGDFNDNLTKIKLAAEGAAISISGPLIKALANASTQFIESKKAGEDYLQTLSRLANTAPRVPDWMQRLPGVRLFDVYQQVGEALSSAPSTGPTAGDFARLDRQPPKVAAPVVPGDDGKKGSKKDPYAEAKSYLENLQRQLEKTKELGLEEQALADIQSGRMGKVTPALEKQILGTARLIDLKKAEKDGLKASEDAAKKAAEAAGKLVDEAAKYAQEVETPFEKLQRHLDELRRAAENNPLISAETAARTGTKYWMDYIKAVEEANKETDKFDDFAKQAAEGIQDSIGEGLVDLMEGNFKNIGDSFVRMLNRMVAEAIAADVSRYLLGNKVKGGSGDGVLGQLFSAGMSMFFGGGGFDMYGGANGAVNSAIMSGVNAGGLGGVSGADQVTDALFRSMKSYDVGTDFVPFDQVALVHKGERIVPAAENKPGYGGVTVVNQFTISGPTDRRTQMQIAAAAAAGAQRGLARNT